MLIFSNKQYITEGFVDSIKAFGNTVKNVAPTALMIGGGLASTLAMGGQLAASAAGIQLRPEIADTLNNMRNYGMGISVGSQMLRMPQQMASMKNMAQKSYQQEKMKQQAQQFQQYPQQNIQR